MGALPPHVGFPDDPIPSPCPACGATGARGIYRVEGIPVSSCLLLDDPERARGFPTGEMLLAHCSDCGFLFNAAFDEARVDYSEDYEETQGCSPTFSAWLEGVVEHLLDAVPRAGGTVVEIGCGRGDFLELLCRRADARGIGVDPSATAGRVDRCSGRGLEFLRESYGPQHAALPADLVACRHTLEHLPGVGELARLLRANLEERPDCRLFIEVPDVLRQLEEGAFWDVYYEHCSYFSPGSLARLLRAARFEVLELGLEYGDQYVQLLARPAQRGAGAAPGLADDLDRLARAVTHFRQTCRASLEHWHGFLTRARSEGRRVALWGSGSKATAFLTTLGAGEAVCAVTDINPAKHGKFVAGSAHPIVAPEELVALAPDLVIAMNPVYRKEIRADLARLGLEPELSAL